MNTILSSLWLFILVSELQLTWLHCAGFLAHAVNRRNLLVFPNFQGSSNGCKVGKVCIRAKWLIRPELIAVSVA